MNLNDAGAGSLRQAILDTPAGGTVDFQPGLSGTITLTSGQLGITKNLTITGPGASVITVSGNHASRVFSIGISTVNISGLTIADGQIRGLGAGIDSQGRLTITSCTLSDNSALNLGPTGSAIGGGIYNSGTLTVISSTLSGNSATVQGGSAPSAGGGIDNLGTLTIINSILSGNSATVEGGSGSSEGGGISSGGPVTVMGSTLSGNSASTGGGILVSHVSLTISSSTISSNNLIGISCIDSTVSVTNSTISGNQGDGISNEISTTPYSTVTITNSTLSGNSADGIYSSSIGLPEIKDTIVAGNRGTGSPDVVGSFNSQGHNLIGDGTGGSGYDPTDLVGTSDNPIDPLLGPLQDNGGPTPTMALLPGSPAIDAGDNTDAPMWDQRGPGFRRIVDGTIDMGAFEVQAHAHNPPTSQPLPSPVPVQALATLSGPLLGQPPALPSDPAPGSAPGLPDGQAGQADPAPVPTAGGPQAADAWFATAGDGLLGAALGPPVGGDLGPSALNPVAGS
jgi:hypothetical protein